MNTVHSVRVDPDRLASGGRALARLDYDADPGAALLVGWSPGFDVTFSGARKVTSQAAQVKPSSTVGFTITRTGSNSVCRMSFTMRGSDGRTDGPPRSARLEVT